MGTFTSGAGDDVVVVEHGTRGFLGGGHDILFGAQERDQISGGPGNDILFGFAGADRLWGFCGRDYLDGGPGRDELLGGPGNDLILGGPDGDHLFGGDGDDVIVGGSGGDFISPGRGADQVFAGPGDDVISYRHACVVNAAAGTLIHGGEGDDTLFSPLGIDELAKRNVRVVSVEKVLTAPDARCPIEEPVHCAEVFADWKFDRGASKLLLEIRYVAGSDLPHELPKRLELESYPLQLSTSDATHYISLGQSQDGEFVLWMELLRPREWAPVAVPQLPFGAPRRRR